MGIIAPQRYVTSIDGVDLDDLKRCGVRGLLLDRDNTVVPRTTGAAPREVDAWMRRARELGFKVCFVSNNDYERVEPTARLFEAGLVAKAHKPRPGGLLQAARDMGLTPQECFVIGDQLYTDIFGAKLAHMRHALVVPQCSQDLWYSPPMRAMERMLLHGLKPASTWEPLAC